MERTQNVLDISATERDTFKRCRRKWEFEVLENIAPVTPPDFNLEFGSGIHRSLEAYYIAVTNIPLLPDTDETYETPLKHALSNWNQWYKETDKKYAEDKNLETATKEIALDNLVELAELGEEMLRGYDRFSEENDDFTVHAIEGLQTPAGKSWLQKHNDEREFVSEHSQLGVKYDSNSRRLLVPIIDPNTKGPAKGNPVLSARIDLLVLRTDPGFKGLWIYDHKSEGSQPSDRGLDFDDQATTYCYAVYRWLGIIPRGICFNYLMKRAPKEPRELKNGDLSTAKDQLTTADKYRKELLDRGLMLKDGRIKDHKHQEAYEALLSHGWDRFFVRHYVNRNAHELMSFEERLFEEWQDMQDCWTGDASLYPSPSRYWCPNCSVAPICQAIEDGSDWEAIIDNRYMDKPDRKAILT